jgi:hypothetical protein
MPDPSAVVPSVRAPPSAPPPADDWLAPHAAEARARAMREKEATEGLFIADIFSWFPWAR